MIFDDSTAFIPLLAIAAVAFVSFFLLVIINRRKTARVSFIAYLADAVIFGGSLFTAIQTLSTGYFSDFSDILILSILIAAVLIVPYLVILCTFEPKKIEKLVPKFVNKKNSAAAQALQATDAAGEVKKGLSEDDKRLLNISRIFMEKATASYNDENGLTVLLDYINKTIEDETHADGAAILIVDEYDDVVTVKSFDGDFPPPYKLPSDMPHKPVRVATNFKFASFPLRDNLFGEIASSGKPELITKPEVDDRIYQNGPEEFLECGSYIVIPMKNGEYVIGLIALSRSHGKAKFNEEEFEDAKTLAGFAATAIQNVNTVKDVIEHNGITKETDLAIKIQNTLRPAKIPVIPGIQIGTYFEQNEGVCGDFYDIIPSRKDRVSFVVGDVAGKGMNSIVIMTMIRAMLRLVVNTKQTAGTILTWVNKGISAESFSTDHFGSCALINYDPVAKQIEYSTGGNTPIFLYSSEKGTIEKISKRSEPIGVEKTSEYENFVHDVKKDDIMVVYTDGLVEALSEEGHQYSKESLLEIIKKNSKASGKDIANLVKADIKKFAREEGQHDDQTLLIVKF